MRLVLWCLVTPMRKALCGPVHIARETPSAEDRFADVSPKLASIQSAPSTEKISLCRKDVPLRPKMQCYVSSRVRLNKGKATPGGSRGGKGLTQGEQPLGGRGSDTEPKCRVDPNDGCASGESVTQSFIARRLTRGRRPVR